MNKKLLLKFCENAANKNYKSPFSIGNYTYATDGNILIKVPRMPEYPENPQVPDPEKIEYEKNPEKWYPITDDPGKGIKMPSLMDCEICEGQGRNFVCPECCGDRVVWLSSDYSEYPNIDCKYCSAKGRVAFCEECNGTGKVTQQKPMNFKGVTFDQRYLALLSKLPNCEIGLISKTTRTPFRFDGGSGIIMPMRYRDSPQK